MPPLPRRDLDHVVEHAGEALKALSGSRIFITGGTGFVGTWLVESVLYANLGIEPVILTRDPDRFRSNNPHLPKAMLVHGDLRGFRFPEGKFPFVIHAATPDPSVDADKQAMRRILGFAADHGTRRFLFTSSGAVYGIQPADLANIPEHSACAPVTDYGRAKLAAEDLCRECDFETIIARLFAFSGPRLPLDRNFAIGNFIRDVLLRKSIKIQGDGTPFRSYLYAADLTVWLLTLLAQGSPGKTYNVG